MTGQETVYYPTIGIDALHSTTIEIAVHIFNTKTLALVWFPQVAIQRTKLWQI